MSLSVTTWNVSGINNNPFEFKTDLGRADLNAGFNKIAEEAENCITESTKTVKDIFTEDLYNKLLDAVKNRFEEGSSGLETMKVFWSEICHEKIPSIF